MRYWVSASPSLTGANRLWDWRFTVSVPSLKVPMGPPKNPARSLVRPRLLILGPHRYPQSDPKSPKWLQNDAQRPAKCTKKRAKTSKGPPKKSPAEKSIFDAKREVRWSVSRSHFPPGDGVHLSRTTFLDLVKCMCFLWFYSVLSKRVGSSRFFYMWSVVVFFDAKYDRFQEKLRANGVTPPTLRKTTIQQDYYGGNLHK